ncbi:hypothetical protein DXG01_003281 [Tephrocybe rancida]|nr:hypothetical protein DXG01_003281 [Tephrocybe rancida]
MRQRSRAFIVADAASPSNRIVFINADIAMGDTGVRRSIISQLSALFPGVYTETNVAFIGTHQHSGVGGYLENLLPQVTSLGYVKQTADAIVAGTVKAVQRAHASLAPGKLSVGNTTILDANINRSPTAYLANPAAERARYQFDQDKDMTVLRFDDANGKARGLLSFFAVHGTSLYENNTLVSADNKGMAAFLYEASGRSVKVQAKIIMVLHAKRTIRRAVERFKTVMAGEKQFQGAQAVMSGNRKSVGALFHFAKRHYCLDLSRRDGLVSLVSCYGVELNTLFLCGKGSLSPEGLLMAPEPLISSKATTHPTRSAITPLPSAAQKACQDPKPILLNTGFAHSPYEWSPSTVDVQMLRVGNFVLGSDAYVVLAGPANTYGHYVTTREEYGVQRYEGASTIFGQYTLEAYIDKYSSLVPFLADNATGVPASDPPPVDQTSKAISLQTGVVFDAAPIGNKFGAVLVDVNTTSYHAGDKVSAQFVGANPRNNLRLESTFLTVDQLVSGQWKTVRSDSHPSTTFQWVRVSTILATSTVTISWTIESGTPSGTYRLNYFGDSKPLIGSISSFSGVSSTFTVA